MSTEQNAAVANEYGFTSDEVKVSPFVFGLNAGKTFLVKFEWIPNGGKDGAEQEALDIVFKINDTEKSYRIFPIVKAFGKNNEEITDRTAPEFKDAIADLNAKITHILHCFVDYDIIKSSFARPIRSFKEFCTVAASILPTNFKEQPLDIFLQYQWQLKGEQKFTYLEIPSKMKYGKWLCPAQAGKWEKKVVENAPNEETKALYYVNENELLHPFIKNGWFMSSNFAKQQKAEGAEEEQQAIEASAEQMNTQGASNAAESKASVW